MEGRFRIEPYVAGAFAWDGSTAIFTPSTKLPPDTEFTIRIAPGFEDLARQRRRDRPGAMGLPNGRAARRGPGDAGRRRDGRAGGRFVVLAFDRLMDTASVEAAIRLDPPASLRPRGAGRPSAWSSTRSSGSGLPTALTVGALAADTGGNRLRDPFALRFTTVAAGLAILDTVPRDGASGIGIRTAVAVRFDAAIDPESARRAFQITPSVNGEIRIVSIADDRTPADGSAGPAREPDTLLFVPDDPLAAHTTYAVTLEPTIARRDDPEAVAAGRSWTFTTGSPTASGQNQIAFLAARSGVRNVWLMNPDGTNPRQLTTALRPGLRLRCDARRRRLAYSAGGIVSLLADRRRRRAAADRDGHVRVRTGLHAGRPSDRSSGGEDRDGADLGYWLVPLPGTPGGERHLARPRRARRLGSADLGGEGIGGTDGTPVLDAPHARSIQPAAGR